MNHWVTRCNRTVSETKKYCKKDEKQTGCQEKR